MKARAVIEVSAVFAAIWLTLVVKGLSLISEWEQQTADPISFIEYTLIIVITLLVMVVTRRNLAPYNLSLRNLRYHLDTAGTPFLPESLSYVRTPISPRRKEISS